ncbi:ATP-binding/permease protein CydD [invertebrate metagenome]|uniref:ATP-binding/permease protein CydD n=1 Tax=invertebrate metagenome TaxID=1711999 RepID=A0A2H9T9U6_9ZZZZ
MSLGLILLRGICTWGREFSGFQAGAQVRKVMRQYLLDKIDRLGPLSVSLQTVGSWSTVLVEQVEELQEFIARYLPQKTLVMILPFVFLTVVFPINWATGLIFLITAPLIPVFMALVGLKAADANRKNFKALSRLGGFFLDRLQGMETLKLFRQTSKAQDELTHASEHFRQKTMEVLRIAFLSSTVLEFFASVSIAVTAVYLGMNFLGYLDFGHYGTKVSLYTGLFLLLLAPEFYQPLRELGTFYHAKARAIGAAESMMEIISQQEPTNQQGILPFQRTTPFALKARNLRVYAPDTHDNHPENLLLDDISFTIHPGHKVAIIGPSGAGKTTLINTLMGFYPFSGILEAAGQSLKETDMNNWRQHLAWLGQMPLIVQATLFENVAFGRHVSEEQVLQAIAKAQALDILNNLPDGIHSELKEEGNSLSVGQAQRIALARALVIPKPLLILDEPTASLDSSNEHQVLDALRQLPHSCTCITVTHRVKEIHSADQILMIDNGKLVADGHPSVLARDNQAFQHFMQGQYRDLDNA